MEVLTIYQTHVITFMYAFAPDDSGNGANTPIYLSTDADIVYILWSVNGTEWLRMYDEGTQSVEEYFLLTGGIKGTKYTAEAKVYFWDGGTDTDSHKFRVFKPKSVSGIKQTTLEKPRVTGVDGSAILSRHYHDGSNIVVDGSVNAYNPTDETCHASSWFRHTEYDTNGFPTGWKLQDPPVGMPNPSTPLPPGGYYYNSGSSSISYPVGGDIGPNQVIVLNAHVHLQVSGNGTTDVWHDNGWTHTFTSADNQ